MPNLFQFSNTAPLDGEIRVFFAEEIDGTKIVRAITVDNNALDGTNIIPTLQQLQSVNMKLTGSGEFSNLQKLSVAQKPTYFFIDNVDIPLNTVSSSLSSSVTFEPFLDTKFDNNDYNPLISNALDTRFSTGKMVIERTSAEVDPVNFESAMGIETRVLTDLSTLPATVSNNLSSPYTWLSDIVKFRNDIDINLTITAEEITKAFGNLNGIIGTGSIAENTDVIMSINILVDNEPEFNANHRFSHPLITHRQITTSGSAATPITETTVFPMNRTILSGSAATATGGGTDDEFFYARMQVGFTRVQPSGYFLGTFTLRPRVLDFNPQQNFLTLRYHRDNPVPYGTRATVPDSNYTVAGFSNARYNGSKTNALDFGGIEPALNARSINVLPLTEGTVTSSFDSPSGSYGRSWFNMNNLLSGVSGSDGLRNEYSQFYQEIAFSGDRDKPGGKVGAVGEFFEGLSYNGLASSGDTTFDIYIEGYGDRIEVGDIITFLSGSTNSKEAMKVTAKSEKINPSNGKAFLNVYTLNVLRGQGSDNVVNNAYDPSKLVISLQQGDRLIKIEGSKVIPQQELLAVLQPEKVKDDPAAMIIAETDSRGFIINTYTSASQDGTS